MTINKVVVPIAALVIGVGSASMAAAQAGERHHNRQSSSERSRDNGSSRQRDDGNRGGGERSRSSSNGDQRAERRGNRDGQSQGGDRQRPQAESQPQQQAQPSQQAESRQRDDNSNRDRGSYNRDNQRSSDSARRDDRGGRYDNGSRNSGRNDDNRAVNRDYSRDNRNSRNSGRSYDRNDRNDYRGSIRADWYRGNWGRNNNGFSHGYYAPRPLYRRSYTPRHYYGSGGRLSLYFGIGSGYRYGSIYSGRVYGYRRGVATYGTYVSYGDVRLKDFPRDAAVYVDGYYAGVVDDFDGFFQRLTLEVGPHEIEVQAGGDDSDFFDVYVDPYNTIDVHADRLR